MRRGLLNVYKLMPSWTTYYSGGSHLGKLLLPENWRPPIKYRRNAFDHSPISKQ
ncbi:hypothetical protein N9004_01380 [Pirellulales bacterium]|nr:hypothetical protein [Pirellulales bacterium]